MYTIQLGLSYTTPVLYDIIRVRSHLTSECAFAFAMHLASIAIVLFILNPNKNDS